MISSGPWSPVTKTPSTKRWETENSQQNVPSFEEIQRMEEEKEKQARVRLDSFLAEAKCLMKSVLEFFQFMINSVLLFGPYHTAKKWYFY